ncbi:hypothetical protein [Fodinibius halophilus]|uniref:Cardiolipin synthase N-terminal domain-containing protein n=1 Tax=Fodinibius halophilus TaxID=1736908 RepID=A0A6M1TBS1_9BACT|nr:hypothetical protein [Fodinibius halophilus]NGP88374.1 hypothetical protein [Fodinibius halophilus]
MRKPVQIILGVLTFLPFIIILAAIGFGVYKALDIFLSPEGVNPFLLFAYFGYAIQFLLFYSLFYLALGIYYLIHIIRNPLFDTEKKGLWIVVIIALNGLAMPAYWYMHIWNTTPVSNSNYYTRYESGTES